MKKSNYQLDKLVKNNTVTKRWAVIVLGIFAVALIIRVFQFPWELPVAQDAIQFFFYAADISANSQLPSNYTPINNGWPIFLSIFFSIFDFEHTQSYMLLQKFIAIIISSLTIIPIFFLVKRYLNTFFGLIGAFIFAIEPRVIENSAIGISDPLFIFLSVTAFVIFLSSKERLIYLSFAIVTFASIVRGEGVLLLIAMFVLFVIRFRKKRLIIPRALLIIPIVFLIMLPISMYRVDITGNDGMFMRLASNSENVVSERLTSNTDSYLERGVQNFPKFLGWSLIPIFILFVPIGFYLVFKERSFYTLSIVMPSFMVSLSAIHVYSVPALDTRYLLPLYPFFIITSVIGIKHILEKSSPKVLFMVILVAIIVGSSVFLQIKGSDYEHDLESYLISKKILEAEDIQITNQFYPESRYLEPADFPQKWSDFLKFFSSERIDGVSIRETVPHGYQLILIKDSESLENFITKNSDRLDHIVVDNQENRPEFIKELFYNEGKYDFLQKIYDSKNDGFDYHVKVFQIDYEKFQNN